MVAPIISKVPFLSLTDFYSTYLKNCKSFFRCNRPPITLVNTQNVSVTKIVDSSSIQRAETKYGLRIHFLALVVMIHEVWLNV